MLDDVSGWCLDSKLKEADSSSLARYGSGRANFLGMKSKSRSFRRGAARGFWPCAARGRLRFPSGGRHRIRMTASWSARLRENGANRKYLQIAPGRGAVRGVMGPEVRR